MSALDKNPKPIVLGVLAVAGLWYLTQRNAGATTSGVPGFGRSPLNPSSGVQAANSRFFVSPSAPGDQVATQAATAARNAGLLGSALGGLQSWLSPLAPSVTAAIPGDMRLSEKASYDVNPAADTLATGDFTRMDRTLSLANDAYVANGPGLADPYYNEDYGQFF